MNWRIQSRGRHHLGTGLKPSAATPSSLYCPAVQEYRNIYPLGPPPSESNFNSHTHPFLSTASLPLPPHFFRSKSASRLLSPKGKSKSTKTPSGSKSDTMGPNKPAFLHKMLSMNFKKDTTDSSHSGDIGKGKRKSVQGGLPVPRIISPSLASFPSLTSFPESDADSGYGSSRDAYLASSRGESSDSGAEVSEDERPWAFPSRRFSIQTEYTTRISQHYQLPLPPAPASASVPHFSNPFSSEFAPLTTTTTPHAKPNGSRRNPRPAYNLSDFLATRRASALQCPPPSPGLGRRRSKGNGGYYGGQFGGDDIEHPRRGSYSNEATITPLPIPPWRKIRKVEVVRDPEAGVQAQD